MEAKTNYTIVGLGVVLLTISLIAGGLWLSVGFDQKKYHLYAVYTREAVSGLNEEAPVKFNGVQVGSVSKIELNETDPQEVRILLSIQEGTPITTNTTATLMAQGITGTSYVGLSASSPDLTPLKKAPEEPYPIIPARPSLFGQIDSVIRKASENINTITLKVNRILDADNAHKLKSTLGHMDKFTATLAENSKKIDSSIANLNVLLRNLADTSKELPGLTQDLRENLAHFMDMTNSIRDAGKQVTQTMSKGKITLEKFSQQTIPTATDLMRRLDTVAANLERVSAQMRQNPAVIIRGTTPLKAGPGE